MSKAFDQIKQGLTEAIKYEDGDKSKAKVTIVTVKKLNTERFYQRIRDKQKPLPCKCCGSEPLKVFGYYSNHSSIPKYKIICKNVKCKMHNNNDLKTSIKQAIQAWNEGKG